jgi:ATP-dependent Clp protease ATP-binding subunit ClpC
MFEKFTDRARRVIVLAQEEARMLEHNYIGTEHILLGVLHEGGGVTGPALGSLGVTLENAREKVVAIVPRGEDAPSGHIPFTPRAKKVLELSLREALDLGHNNIRPEHILLGLIREGEGVASHVLLDLGVSGERVHESVLTLIHDGGGESESGPEAGLEPGPVPAGLRVVGTPLQLEAVMGQLMAINARLEAIERQLGLAPPRAAGEPPDEAGSPGEAGSQAG